MRIVLSNGMGEVVGRLLSTVAGGEVAINLTPGWTELAEHPVTKKIAVAKAIDLVALYTATKRHESLHAV